MASMESIYNLIPQPVPEPIKPERYKSNHSGTKAPTFSTFGLSGTSKPGYKNVAGADAVAGEGHHTYQKSHATMGTMGNAKKPSDILKKGTGGGGGAADLAMASASGYAFKYSDRRMPSLPTKAEFKEVSALLASNKKETNFITANAVENILAVPKREEDGVDWLKKPHFGEVPPYLVKIKQEIADEYDYIKSMQQQQMMDAEDGPPGMRLMPDDERNELVRALKIKWDEVNKRYQSTSVLSLASLDTIGKVKRKEQYEAQLAQIEKDIEKLSKKNVYVAEEA